MTASNQQRDVRKNVPQLETSVRLSKDRTVGRHEDDPHGYPPGVE